MADGERVKHLTGNVSDNVVRSEIERLENILIDIEHSEIYMCEEFNKSEIGQITEMFLRNMGEQITSLDYDIVAKFIYIVSNILETNRQNISLNKMIDEHKIGKLNRLREFKEATIVELQDLLAFLQALIDSKNQQDMIAITIKDLYKEHMDTYVYTMLTDLWSDWE